LKVYLHWIQILGTLLIYKIVSRQDLKAPSARVESFKKYLQLIFIFYNTYPSFYNANEKVCFSNTFNAKLTINCSKLGNSGLLPKICYKKVCIFRKNVSSYLFYMDGYVRLTTKGGGVAENTQPLFRLTTVDYIYIYI
jgi:hypothetical protein